MLFRVHSKLGRTFHRNRQAFTPEPRVIDTDALGWTEAEMKEFLGPSTRTALHIEPVEAAPPAADPPGPVTTSRAELAETPEGRRPRR